MNTDLFVHVTPPATRVAKERYVLTIAPKNDEYWKYPRDARIVLKKKLIKAEDYVRYLKKEGKITQWYGADASRIGIYVTRELYEEVHATLSAFLKLMT